MPQPTRPAPLSVAATVRPALILTERDGRDLLSAARTAPPGALRYLQEPSGIAVLDAGGRVLGSVGWTWDTPVRHHLTVHRVALTEDGARAGWDAAAVLQCVLRLAGLQQDGPRAALPVPPPRDPFRAARPTP